MTFDDLVNWVTQIGERVEVPFPGGAQPGGPVPTSPDPARNVVVGQTLIIGGKTVTVNSLSSGPTVVQSPAGFPDYTLTDESGNPVDVPAGSEVAGVDGALYTVGVVRLQPEQ